MNRIEQCFARLKGEGQKGLIVYIGAGDPNLEKTALSHHQKAMPAFALFLASEESSALGSAIETLSRGARWWVKIRGWIGGGIQWIGKWLTTPLDNNRSAKVWATTQVAREQISQAQITLASRMLETDT